MIKWALRGLITPEAKWLVLIFMLFTPLQAWAGVSLQSGPEKVLMIELYTSEGCSSCPRADEQFSAARYSKLLWKKFVPAAFHVDYWDRLGWVDKLSDPANTERQYQFAQKWNLKRVYTPMFVKDGQEFLGNPLKLFEVTPTAGNAGMMDAMQVNRVDFEVRYKPPAGTGQWRIHYALLGSNIHTHVKSGENNKRDLIHNFAVLSHGSQVVETRDGVAWLPVRFPDKLPGIQKSVVFWVTGPGDLEPVQALGGDLSKEDS